MSLAAKAIEARFGDIFLYNSENKNIVSEESSSKQGQVFSIWTTLLDTGSVNPSVLIALVKGSGSGDISKLKDLKWSSVHIRSYHDWNEMKNAGVKLTENNPQKPTQGALHTVEDLEMEAVSQTENSKTYFFENKNDGRVTLFTSKPVINTGGNDLPRKTTFIPWLTEYNMVYER